MRAADLDYYSKRVAEERARAAAATRADVRHAHLELAALYAARLAEAEPRLRVLVR